MSNNFLEATNLSPLFFSHTSFSLYIHVPFCAHKCGYCDFYSKATRSGTERFLDAIELEIDLYLKNVPELATKTIKSIFVGGGTPSILTESEWSRLASKVTNSFTLESNCEWTIEVNPESFSESKARAWLSSGVNRLSFGVQSLNDEILKKAGRIHSAKRVIDVLSNPILEQFSRISCDTIYGLPGQKLEDVRETLKTLLTFPQVTHISAYELTIAEDTPFAQIPTEMFPDDEILADYEEVVLETLSEAGFIRYEVSNYARLGHECVHNQIYWNMSPYLGIGPSAHSFDGLQRFGDVDSLEIYCDKISTGNLPWGFTESLSAEMYRSEFLFLALRTSNGIAISDYERLFGESIYSGIKKGIIEELQIQNCAQIENGRFFLTQKGLNLADGVALKLS